MGGGRGREASSQANIVNYADDFVILSRGKAAQALQFTERGPVACFASPRGEKSGPGPPLGRGQSR